jgi:hypothetical protein
VERKLPHGRSDIDLVLDTFEIGATLFNGITDPCIKILSLRSADSLCGGHPCLPDS